MTALLFIQDKQFPDQVLETCTLIGTDGGYCPNLPGLSLPLNREYRLGQ